MSFEKRPIRESFEIFLIAAVSVFIIDLQLGGRIDTSTTGLSSEMDNMNFVSDLRLKE